MTDEEDFQEHDDVRVLLDIKHLLWCIRLLLLSILFMQVKSC